MVFRYYGKPENLGSILGKVAWFLAKLCRRHLTSPGPLWDQKRTALVTNLNNSVRVHEALIAVYRSAMRLRLSLGFGLASQLAAPEECRKLLLRLPAASGSTRTADQAEGQLSWACMPCTEGAVLRALGRLTEKRSL